MNAQLRAKILVNLVRFGPAALVGFVVSVGPGWAPPPQVSATPPHTPGEALDAAEAPGLPMCEGLAAHEDPGPDRATMLARLCPAQPLGALLGRDALAGIEHAVAAIRVGERLTPQPDWERLARLVSLRDETRVSGPLPDPAKTSVTPLTDQVLAWTQLSRSIVAAPGVSHEERTRARAFLAKVYFAALDQFGVDPTRPPHPFERLLAGWAIHYGRAFCVAYWQRRVGGLETLFAETEVDLLEAILSLEAGGFHADAAITTVSLTRGRRYVRQAGPKRRIASRLANGPPVAGVDPTRVLPLADELSRLLDRGFVDLAIATTLERGAATGGPGLLPAEQLLRDGLANLEGTEYAQLLATRLSRKKKREPPPLQTGPGSFEHPRDPRWPSADEVADIAHAMIRDDRGPADAVTAARLLYRRPDALSTLIDRLAEDGSLGEHRHWLAPIAESIDDGSLRWLKRRAALTDPAAAEDQTRRNYALRAREAGRQPR